MNLFRRSIELVVIRDIFNPQNNIETYTGYDVEQLLKQAFGSNGLSDSVRLYHGSLLDEITPKTPDDVDKVMRLHGRIYAVVKPMGLDPFSWAVIGISVLASVAVAFLMPMPNIPTNQATNQPPSPNNALAARTNQQRLGGRIPDVYGTVWSVPDLIAPTYSVYIKDREVEFSYMCVGRGQFNVTQALDDTTPINQVNGSSVMVFDPDDSLNDTPDFLFGSAFTPDEAELSRLTVKRYTSVNGQLLSPPDNYYTLDKAIFRAGGIIELGGFRFQDIFAVGYTVYVTQSVPAASANGVLDVNGDPVLYSLSGIYTVLSVTPTKLTLSGPELVNSDWQKLSDNADYTVQTEAVVSTQTGALWQGYFYTNSKDHEYALVNFVANGGLYITRENKYQGIGLEIQVESQLVDINNNPISGTLTTTDHIIYGSSYKTYALNGGIGVNPYGVWQTGYDSTTDDLAQSTGTTIKIMPIGMQKGDRLRFRVRRKTFQIISTDYSVQQDLRIADFYGARLMTAADAPKGVTTVYTKTLATEGALSLKERKLRLLVQRYVTDSTSGLSKLSNRADDILRDIATDPKIGNLQLTQVDIAQIKAEIDAQIAYFGTDKCSEFCGTFDDNNLSAEETMQIVAKAVFSQAKRQGNKIMLDFERKVPASVAVFNSHNILPDTFTAPQSLGIANDYDGVKVEYTDPVDDAVITMSYPNDAITNPHEDKLIGVRNKVQAHTHMMRMYNKDRHAYKSCEFVAGDESNIVVRTNRITVADQLRADVQQGSVDSIETIGGDIVLHTTDPVTIEPSGAYTMFIQTINNGVESIAVTARDDYSVKLARLPSGEISGTDKAVQAVYQIVLETDDNRDAYLVAQKYPSDGMTNKLLCTNYDDRYYQNDKDHIAPPHVFTPLDLFIGGKQGAWYDPSDLSTLYQDAAGTVPVTADGQPVGLIKDKSGNGNHAKQANNAKRPVYKTNGMLHSLRFSGTGEFLVATYLSELNTPSTLFAGFDVIAAQTAKVFITGLSAAARHQISTASTGLISSYGGSGSISAEAIKAQKYVFTSRLDGESSNLIVNGVVTQGSLSSSSIKGMTIGAVWDGLASINADFYGALQVEGLADTTDLQEYLRAKMGVI